MGCPCFDKCEKWFRFVAGRVCFQAAFLSVPVLWLCACILLRGVPRFLVCSVFLDDRTCRVLWLFRTCVGGLRARMCL